MTEILDTLRSPILLAASLACGLQAGTHYTWACGVMPGLARVDDRTFVDAVQKLNIAIVNPVFLLSFLGAVREASESDWVRLNIARTVTATASLGCLVWAALRH